MLIVPTYNERENIGELIGRVRAAIPELPVLFIDDNSPDGTADVIRRLKKQDPLISLIERPKKLGLASAYIQAFRRVLEGKLADYVVSFDADLSHQPETLPDFIKYLESYPVVVGSRYVKGGVTRNWHPVRRAISRVGNFYAQALTGLPVRDITSGMVGYRIDYLSKIPLHEISSDGYAFQIEMKLKLYQAGARMIERPIEFVERREGQSKFTSTIVMEGIHYPIKVFLKRIL